MARAQAEEWDFYVRVHLRIVIYFVSVQMLYVICSGKLGVISFH